jgi:hypothetical protein
MTLLFNQLGTGLVLHWVKGPSDPQEKTIDFNNKKGVKMPSWSVWNVKDESHYYGTITLKEEGDHWTSHYPPPEDKGHSLVGVVTPLEHYGDPVLPQVQLRCAKVIGSGPPIISNKNWANGQRNASDTATHDVDFWVTDYGQEKWSPVTPINDKEPQAQGIQQSTAGPDWGSRAYPIHIDKDPTVWKVSGSKYGVAKEGLWQIAIKIGSTGQPDDGDKTPPIGWCETFYIAERLPPLKGDPHDLHWGADYYSDGQGGGLWGDKEQQEKELSTKKVPVWKDPNPKEYGKLVEGRGAYSREIDIMETMWSPKGPQINLGNMGGGTAWNVHAKTANYGLKQPFPLWSEVGGAPTKDFIIFGCLIRGDNLWLYAYKGPGVDINHKNGQWYCTDAIPKKPDKDPRTGKLYEQKGPFVPYIGTWTNGKKDGNFFTKYNHFIYLRHDDPQLRITETGRLANPLDNWNYFGWRNGVTGKPIIPVDY